MTETKTYPTPAADMLAAHAPLLEEQIERYRQARTKYWDESFTVEQLHDAMRELEVRSMAKSTGKATLVAVLVDEYDLKLVGDFGPLQELRRLKRRADEERYILAGVRDHVVQDVDARYRAAITSARLGLNPVWLEDTARTWQEARSVAICWGFVASTIDKGKTPIEAATDAVGHFTNAVIQAARGPRESITTVVLDSCIQKGYAKFLDRLTVLDGVVSTEGF